MLSVLINILDSGEYSNEAKACFDIYVMLSCKPSKNQRYSKAIAVKLKFATSLILHQEVNLRHKLKLQTFEVILKDV